MVDGQVAHTPTSYHKYYHPTMPLNFFVNSLATSSPTLGTCLSAITDNDIRHLPNNLYLYHCHHSHQHQYSCYSPTMSLTSFVSSLEIFQWQNQKVGCFYQVLPLLWSSCAHILGEWKSFFDYPTLTTISVTIHPSK